MAWLFLLCCLTINLFSGESVSGIFSSVEKIYFCFSGHISTNQISLLELSFHPAFENVQTWSCFDVFSLSNVGHDVRTVRCIVHSILSSKSSWDVWKSFEKQQMTSLVEWQDCRFHHMEIDQILSSDWREEIVLIPCVLIGIICKAQEIYIFHFFIFYIYIYFVVTSKFK